jgi:alpha-L-fucosidase 2
MKIIARLFVYAALSALLYGCTKTEKKDLMLWYEKPASKWEEALPIGNGRIGAMIYGGIAEEHIQFNEETLWTGRPHDY